MIYKQVNDCHSQDCELDAIRRWLKNKKACTSANCENDFSSIFSRFEQKQVDSHIVADLIVIGQKAREGQKICVVSDDLDILPGIQALLALETKREIIVLQTEKANWYNEPLLVNSGLKVIRMTGKSDEK